MNKDIKQEYDDKESYRDNNIKEIYYARKTI